ncbi:MAG TPA: hypothetical protein VFP41_13295, partial [Actinomycetota bacterium]|nr:hypothetical protein [Actinomycetota bacterium]
MATVEKTLDDLEQEAIDALQARTRTRSRIVYSVLGALSFIAVWAFFSAFVFEPYVLPSPGRVLVEMWELTI